MSTHEMMIASRQAAEDSRLIEAANNILESDKFSQDILDGIRAERDRRQARLDTFVAEYGASRIAF